MRHLGLPPPTRYSVAPRRGELGGNRTHDPRIKSALLYRLSYELISKFQSITMGRAGWSAQRPRACGLTLPQLAVGRRVRMNFDNAAHVHRKSGVC